MEIPDRAAEIVGTPFSALIPKEHRDQTSTSLQRIRRCERIEYHEGVRVKKGGGLASVALTESPNLHVNCYITKPVQLTEFPSVVKSIDFFWLALVRLPPHIEP